MNIIINIDMIFWEIYLLNLYKIKFWCVKKSLNNLLSQQSAIRDIKTENAPNQINAPVNQDTTGLNVKMVCEYNYYLCTICYLITSSKIMTSYCMSSNYLMSVKKVLLFEMILIKFWCVKKSLSGCDEFI